MRGIAAAFTTSLVLFTGCIADPVDQPGPDQAPDPSDDVVMTARTDEPSPAAVTPGLPVSRVEVDGGYRLQSTLDVGAQALLPQSAFDVLVLLEGLRDHPGRTLFDLAEEAGVPAVGEVRDALPSYLEDRVYGWIDSQVGSVTNGDGTVAQVLDTVISVCHTELGEVHLQSRLALAGGEATHTLDTVELAVGGQALAYDVSRFGAILDLEATVPVTIERDPDGATTTLGAHGFGLPYGELAWAAIEDLVRARYGRDLRAQLGAMVGCPAVAASVASRCYLGQCVGHQAQLAQICEAGLDHAVAKARAKVVAARVEPIAFASGTARTTDGVHLDGTWSATIDLGQGVRPAPAAFDGLRQ